ncbi:unnamed protein product, partial [Didymodactylos carnosus]
MEETERVLHNVLSRISKEKAKIILLLCRKLKVINYPSLLKFLHKTLIENENQIERNETFKILQSLKFDSNNVKYIDETIKLEKKCLTNDQSVIKDCLEHVKMKNKLTLNCFKELIIYFSMNETSEIIREIVEQDIQKLPKCFTEKFHEYVKSSSS